MSKKTPIQHTMDELINLEKRKLKKQVFDVIDKVLRRYEIKEILKTEMEKVFA